MAGRASAGSIYNIYFSKVYEFRTQGIGLPSGFWDVTRVTAVTASQPEF